jgi:hypothetical protein
MYDTVRAEQQRKYAKLEREQHMHYTQIRRHTLRRLAQKIEMQLRALLTVPHHGKQMTPSSTAAR